MDNNNGARIERGIITNITDNGYSIKNLTRYSLDAENIPAQPGIKPKVGDRVYFFLFGDGQGLILAAF